MWRSRGVSCPWRAPRLRRAGAGARAAPPPRRLRGSPPPPRRAPRPARAPLAGPPPPPEARELHRRLLAVFALNPERADEPARLAASPPAATAALRPLGRANRRLSSGLRAAAGKDAQRQALARYA